MYVFSCLIVFIKLPLGLKMCSNYLVIPQFGTTSGQKLFETCPQRYYNCQNKCVVGGKRICIFFSWPLDYAKTYWTTKSELCVSFTSLLSPHVASTLIQNKSFYLERTALQSIKNIRKCAWPSCWTKNQIGKLNATGEMITIATWWFKVSCYPRFNMIL